MESSPLYQQPVDPEALQLVNADLARHYKILPLGFEGDRLRVAMADETVFEDIRALTNRDLIPVKRTPVEILEAIDVHYHAEKPSPVTNASRFSAALDSADVLQRFEGALRMKTTQAREKYVAHYEEASEPEIELADALLRQGARAQARLFVSGGSIFEELDGRFYKTGEIAEELNEPTLRRLARLAGLDARVKSGAGRAHLAFEAEIAGRMWPFEVDVALLRDDRGTSALLSFIYKS